MYRIHYLLVGFTHPTPVQRAVIPRLLNGENLVMAASTGSGKTLAYTLPAIQNLIMQEQQVNKTTLTNNQGEGYKL
jgi:superfamily II DNA/RNA helicase